MIYTETTGPLALPVIGRGNVNDPIRLKANARSLFIHLLSATHFSATPTANSNSLIFPSRVDLPPILVVDRPLDRFVDSTK